MPTYRTSFTTPTPIDTAFDYLSRFSTTVEWDPGVVDSRQLTPDPVGLGSAFEITSAFLGRKVVLRYEIVAFERPGLVTLRAEDAMLRSLDTITFVEGDHGTTITYDADLALKGVARVLTPLMAVAFRTIGDRAAAGLRAKVDALASPDHADQPRTTRASQRTPADG